ncbi:MAG: exonuclease SbcCD subunit D [Candidatus Latescibacteria bacterium]|nr:exonuclease SbcCD subunit D [Candidatus Latescibacterota bacterium]
MGLRFLHFADLHLGVETYGRLDPQSGLNTRVQDFVYCLAAVVDLALRERVDLVLFAGDAYKTCDPEPTYQREFAQHLRRLRQAGIPVVLVVGNHDTPAAYGRATALDIFGVLELDNTHVIRRPQLLRIETRNGPLQVAGLPWPTRHSLRTRDEYKDLPQEALNQEIQGICAEQIAEFARTLDPRLPAVFTAHLAAAEATYSGSERTAVIGQDPVLLTSTLANPAFDYVALGHVHKHQDLHPQAAPSVVYAGSIERLNFGEEHDPKGCCLVHIETPPSGERRTTWEFASTPARRFLTIEAEIPRDAADPTACLLETIAAHQLEGAVVRLTYPQPGPDQAPVDLARVRAALAPTHHLAGILPRLVTPTRLRRATVDRELDLSQALDRYIDNLPELQGQRQTLQQYAGRLRQELETGERAEDLQP